MLLPDLHLPMAGCVLGQQADLPVQQSNLFSDAFLRDIIQFAVQSLPQPRSQYEQAQIASLGGPIKYV